MSPKLQASVWLGAAPVMLQVPGPAYAGLIDQLTPVPPGSGSERVTALAVPVPWAAEFDTVMVKPIGSPALTEVASAVLVIDRSGAITTIVADASTSGWFEADAVAVFGYVPALPLPVALVTWTEIVAPGAMSPKLQASVWLGAAPVTLQVPGPPNAGLIDQFTPVPPGSGSDRVTALAVPVPCAA